MLFNNNKKNEEFRTITLTFIILLFSALHIAIQNKNKEIFNKLLNASRKMYCTDLLGAQNFAGEVCYFFIISVKNISTKY